MSKFKSKYFWVKLGSGCWKIAERRFSHRYFICGVGHIINERIEGYHQQKSGYDIVEIGQEVVCPHT